MRSHALIVGGTKGMGRALVRLLAAEGETVTVIGRSPVAKADALSGVRYLCADVSDQDDLPRLVEEVAKGGKLRKLAFFQRFRGVEDDWAGEIAVTLTATKRIIEETAQHFTEGGDKAIVVVGSIAGRCIVPEQPLSYHLGKAGLEQIVRYYAVQLGPRGTRVNGVAPATTLKEESKRFYLDDEELSRMYRVVSPLGRMGTAEECADVIAFLLSEKASLVNGQIITLDGGIGIQGHEGLCRRAASVRSSTEQED